MFYIEKQKIYINTHTIHIITQRNIALLGSALPFVAGVAHRQ